MIALFIGFLTGVVFCFLIKSSKAIEEYDENYRKEQEMRELKRKIEYREGLLALQKRLDSLQEVDMTEWDKKLQLKE